MVCTTDRFFRPYNSSFSGSFDFLDDGVDPDEYSFQISNFYTGKSLWNADTDDSEGLFELKDIKEGSKLNFCFENHLEDDDDEDFSLDVGFSVRISNPPRGLEDGEIGPDAERALSLAQKATAIHQDWEVMMDHMMFVRSREANHQSMHDAILGRLSRWTYIEAFLVIGMATGQVLYWKKFFETRRYL